MLLKNYVLVLLLPAQKCLLEKFSKVSFRRYFVSMFNNQLQGKSSCLSKSVESLHSKFGRCLSKIWVQICKVYTSVNNCAQKGKVWKVKESKDGATAMHVHCLKFPPSLQSKAHMPEDPALTKMPIVCLSIIDGGWWEPWLHLRF